MVNFADVKKKCPTILIADDDASVVTHVKEMVQLFGYRPVYTTNPDHIIPILSERCVDLVLLDFHFKDRTGLEVMKEIHKDPEIAGIPIIFLTGETDELVLAKCFDGGAADFLNKPINSLELRARMNSCLLLSEERRRYRKLLLHVVPHEVSREVLLGRDLSSDKHQQITVVSAHLTDFDETISEQDPSEVISYLQEYFNFFDSVVDKYSLNTVKVSGCAYTFVGGLYSEDSCQAQECVSAAKEIRDFVRSKREEGTSMPWNVRIGINTGPAISGVISGNRVVHNVWGYAVNGAQQMEALCEPGRIRLAAETELLLPRTIQSLREESINLDGRNRRRTFILE